MKLGIKEIYREGDFVAVHMNPIWREKSDFLIRAHFEKTDGANGWEQLWVKQLSENRFSICCIPFFTYGLSLGDEIATYGIYQIQGVAKKSGHSTFRVWFTDESDLESQSTVLRQLGDKGSLFEYYSNKFLGISVDTGHSLQEIFDILQALEVEGKIEWENG